MCIHCTSLPWPSWRGQSVLVAGAHTATCGLSCTRNGSKMLVLQNGRRLLSCQERELPSRRMVVVHRRTCDFHVASGALHIETSYTRRATLPGSASCKLCVLLTMAADTCDDCAGGIMHDLVRDLLVAPAGVGMGEHRYR